MFKHWKTICLSAAACLSAPSIQAQDFVWWEGEKPAETNFPKTSAFDPADREQANKLSAGAWLSGSGNYKEGEKKLFAKYTVTVPADGTYQLWSRKFWKHGPFKWRFNNDEWKFITRDISLTQSVSLRKHLTASWAFMADVTLSKGEHQFEIELTHDEQKTACFDSFLLFKGAFVPNGKLKPGEKTGDVIDDSFFAWEPGPDPLTNESVIDLRHLNEPSAGYKGFVKRKGNGFVTGDGKEQRFWMVQLGFTGNDTSIQRWARRLAKYGVNLGRVQLSAFFASHKSGDDALFEKRLERLHFHVAEMKKQGIYTYLGHLYWHTHTTLNDDVFPGFGPGKGNKPVALLFFSEKFQDYYINYVKRIMTAKNPYTGISLAEDPAVAFFEIQNESGVLFWPFKPKSFPEVELEIVEKKFAAFLIKKHGSLDKALAAWGDNPRDEHHTPDQFDKQRAGLYGSGHLTGAEWAVAQRNPKRAYDQIQFLHESVRNFVATMKKRLQDEVGLGQLIVGSNWKTADYKTLGAIEYDTYEPGDVICRNSYFGVNYPKGGQQRFYAIELNDTFKYHSALKPPARPGPLATPQVAGHPFMITENNWTRPNRYRSEWPFLIATYAKMMGIDGWNFFSLGAPDWQVQMQVWDINNPSILGQFPATALIFRRGDVTEPESAAVHEERNLEDIYNLKGTELYAISGKDDLWVAKIGDKEGQQSESFGVDPRAYFVGPVTQKLSNKESKITKVDLSKYIDDDAKTITSVTNELHWDYGDGIVTVNTPTAQGASGFLNKGGTIKVGDITIKCDNEYATILVVSLDGKPLKESGKILIQAGTYDLPYGFETEQVGEYEKITNLGGYPLNVKRVKCTVTLPNGKTASVLDGNGYRTDRKAKTTISGGALTVTLPEDSLYTVVE